MADESTPFDNPWFWRTMARLMEWTVVLMLAQSRFGFAGLDLVVLVAMRIVAGRMTRTQIESLGKGDKP